MLDRNALAVSDPFPRRSSLARCLVGSTVLAVLASSAVAQLQFDELGKRQLPSDDERSFAVALGDVDGDGDRDVVIGNEDAGNGRQQNRLYLNDGAGTFTDATAAGMPTDSDDTHAVALGDVDGDGDLDLVFGDYRSQNRVYLNDGRGHFTRSRMPRDSDPTTSVALADVDGDGDLDLVFGNDAQNRNRLYLNDGTGVFTDATASRMPFDSDPTSAVAPGDVDGDGDVDLVFANDGRENRLYLNDGTGTFTDATARVPSTSFWTRSLALGDVDGDGDLDLICGNGDDSVAEQNRLYVNDGTGTFSDVTLTRMPASRDRTLAVVLGDVDGDGDLDLVCGNGSLSTAEQNRLYVNDGTGTFSDVTATRMPANRDLTLAVALGDVDGYGDPDLVFGNWGQNQLLLNDGTGDFTDTTAGRLPSDRDSTRTVASGDVDGDGDPDLVFGDLAQNRLYLNDGRGHFTDATAARLPPDTSDTVALAFGDVDGDGDPDLVCANAASGQNRLYLNDGTGRFTDGTAGRLPAYNDDTHDVALGDVDGDGDLDIVYANYFLQNRLYLNDGQGHFTERQMPPDNDSTKAVALGDVDGDGDLDLVFGNSVLAVAQNRLYLNDGRGSFTDATSRMPRDSDMVEDVVLGDVDGDGDSDLVFANERGVNKLYFNDGTGTFSNVTAARLPRYVDDSYAVALGDVDGDGDPDLVFGNGFSGFGDLHEQNRLYLNDGTGTFSDATAVRLPVDDDSTHGVVLGDVDGDDDLDLVFATGFGQNRLYLNLLRQLAAPPLVVRGREYRLRAYARYGPPRLVDIAVPFVATATAQIPLPPFGTIGLDPTVMIGLPLFVIPQPVGTSFVSVLLPDDPNLVGVTLYAQALLVQHPSLLRLTNVTADPVVR